jgi:uncharacterized protein
MQPVQPDQRVALLDILRGFALTGVLLVNMMSYGAYGDRWSGPMDRSFHLVEFLFFEHRFWHLFSLLFGIGFAIQYSRAAAKGAPFVSRYVRRLFFLLGFGAVSNILWRVDILTDYAVLGLLLIPMRRWSTKVVLVAALCAQLAPPVIEVVRSRLSEPVVESRPTVIALEAETAASPSWGEEEHFLRAEGSFPEVVAGHARRYLAELRNPDMQPSLGFWWGYLAMFVLGLYVGKRKILQEYERHRSLVRTAGWVGLLLGIVGVGLATWQEFAGLSPSSWSPWLRACTEALTLLGYTGMMCFYVYGVSVWSLTNRWPWLRTGFTAVGRTALSNYLLQAFLINLLFMGWGFGFYDRLGPTATMLASVPIYLALMVGSIWWVRRFRYGPAEWLWRTLTYGAVQPMRITSGTGTR